jgi:hypothetical protein
MGKRDLCRKDQSSFSLECIGEAAERKMSIFATSPRGYWTSAQFERISLMRTGVRHVAGHGTGLVGMDRNGELSIVTRLVP